VIFPNPFQTHIRIIKSDFYDVHVVIATIAGKKVYDYSEIESNQLFVEIPLEHLADGVYVLSLYYDNNFRTFRLIKE